jgi:hypothetical protein
VWGDSDLRPPVGWLLNRKPVLAGDDQRAIARVFSAAFLEATLHGDERYVPLFRDHRVGEKWLPDTILISRYEDSTQQVVCNYEEDLDLESTTVPGGTIHGANLSSWRENGLTFRNDDSKNNNAVMLGWSPQHGEASYEIGLPAGLSERWKLSRNSSLLLSVANAAGGNDPSAEQPVDFSVELIDAAGVMTRMPLSRFGPVLPAIEVKLTKWPYFEQRLFRRSTVQMLQTYELPIEEFQAASPRFRPDKLRNIRFVFDRSRNGQIIMDDIGFRHL